MGRNFRSHKVDISAFDVSVEATHHLPVLLWASGPPEWLFLSDFHLTGSPPLCCPEQSPGPGLRPAGGQQ